MTQDEDCDWCGKPAILRDPYGAYCSKECQENEHERQWSRAQERRLDAPSMQEEYERAWKQKRELDRP